MDYAAVKTILGAPNLTRRHARWWSDAYDVLITLVKRIYMLTVFLGSQLCLNLLMKLYIPLDFPKALLSDGG